LPRPDIIVAVLLVVVAAFVTWILNTRLSFTATNLDVWFDSDSLFVLDQISNRYSEHNNTNSRHPIFSMLVYPLMFCQTRLLGIDGITAAFNVLVLTSSLCVLAMYGALRLAGRTLQVAVIFTSIFTASTTGMLFLGIHERLIPGGISVLVCLIAFQLHERRLLPGWTLVLAAAGTLGITVTNFIVGVAALLAGFGIKRGLQGSVNAFCLVALLSVGNNLIFGGPGITDVRTWPMQSSLFTKNADRLETHGSIVHKAANFGLHSIVMPVPRIERKPPPWSDTQYLSLQRVGLGPYAKSGYIALALWLVLICAGIFLLARRKAPDKLDAVLAMSLAGQFVLFLVFGSETILYAPYYAPLLILIASKPWPTPRLNTALPVVAWTFLLLLVWNNAEVLGLAIEMAHAVL
jgi:hypothetical protein